MDEIAESLPGSDKDEIDSKIVNENEVEINLKHWHSGCQCISEWQPKDLKAFRKFIDKAQGLTPSAMRADPGLEYELHKGLPKGHGFSKPTSIPKDITLAEMKVSGKARVHGFLRENQFYLIWLDRSHEVFPSGK